MQINGLAVVPLTPPGLLGDPHAPRFWCIGGAGGGGGGRGGVWRETKAGVKAEDGEGMEAEKG